MQYGISVPNFGAYFDPRVLAALARDAEQAGWDGFFLWDHCWASIRDRCPWWIRGWRWRLSPWQRSACASVRW